MRLVPSAGEPPMTRAMVTCGTFATALVLLAGLRALEQRIEPAAALEQEVDTAASTSPAITPSPAAAAPEADQGFLYGRVTTTLGGNTYEGRLRFGGDQEAFWGDYFNGAKSENPWVAYIPLELLPKERPWIEIFG